MSEQNFSNISNKGITLHPETARIEMNLGYACNNHCIFCSEAVVRKSDVGKKVNLALSTEYLIKQLLQHYKNGFRHVTFLGGEPTIRKDFLMLVKVAKKLGYETIFLTTNGRMLSKMDFAERIFRAGVNKLYLSLHGHNAEIHDFAVSAKGAFEQITKAMGNVRELGMPFQLSSVIFKGNVKHLKELAEFQITSKPKRVFWAFVRPTGAARENFEEIVPSFEEMEKPLRAAVEVFRQNKIPFTVAHVPFCRMSGIEKYVDELYWGDQTVERGVDKYVSLGNDNKTGDHTVVTKSHYKMKSRSCLKCKYLEICEGVHTEYVKRKGFLEFTPVEGEKVLELADLQDKRLLQENE